MDEPASAFVAGRIGGCFAMPFIAFMARIITPSRRNVKFFRRASILSRSGVAPPTGTIHPRESRGTTDGKQESNKRFILGRCLSGFGIAGGHLAGVDHSGRGFNPRPAQGRPTFPNRHKQERINNTISALRFRFPCLRGRTLRRPWALSRSGVAPPTGTIHPRESRGTTDEKQESNKRFISGEVFPDLELREDIWRGWSFPVGGSTPDRHQQERVNSALRFRFPCLRGWTLRRPWTLSRSGVAPPTGTIHPRPPVVIPDIFIPRGWVRGGYLTSRPRGMKIPE